MGRWLSRSWSSPPQACGPFLISCQRWRGITLDAEAGGLGAAVIAPAFAVYLGDFAADRFFEAHEALEGLWWARDSDPFLQGLILFAAAYVKLQRGSAAGALKHFTAVGRYLQPYAPQWAGIDVAALLQHAGRAAESLAPYALPGGPPLPVGALGTTVPRFRFTSGPAVGVLPPGSGSGPGDGTVGPSVQQAVVAALADRRAAGAPVGPASWGALVKEVTRRTGGRLSRALVRDAVRQALGADGGSHAP